MELHMPIGELNRRINNLHEAIHKTTADAEKTWTKFEDADADEAAARDKWVDAKGRESRQTIERLAREWKDADAKKHEILKRYQGLKRYEKELRELQEKALDDLYREEHILKDLKEFVSDYASGGSGGRGWIEGLGGINAPRGDGKGSHSPSVNSGDPGGPHSSDGGPASGSPSSSSSGSKDRADGSSATSSNPSTGSSVWDDLTSGDASATRRVQGDGYTLDITSSAAAKLVESGINQYPNPVTDRIGLSGDPVGDGATRRQFLFGATFLAEPLSPTRALSPDAGEGDWLGSAPFNPNDLDPNAPVINPGEDYTGPRRYPPVYGGGSLENPYIEALYPEGDPQAWNAPAFDPTSPPESPRPPDPAATVQFSAGVRSATLHRPAGRVSARSRSSQ
jgi:hypothetical protein